MKCEVVKLQVVMQSFLVWMRGSNWVKESFRVEVVSWQMLLQALPADMLFLKFDLTFHIEMVKSTVLGWLLPPPLPLRWLVVRQASLKTIFVNMLSLPLGLRMLLVKERWWNLHLRHHRSSTTMRRRMRTMTRSRWPPQRCLEPLLGIGSAVWAGGCGAPPAAGPGRVAAELLGQKLATARSWRRSSQATRLGCSLCTQSSSFEGSPSV